MSSSVGYTGGPQVINFRPTGDHTWTREAACATEGVAPMFPLPGDAAGLAAAKLVCGVCPVRDACLTAALERNERFGVWGGLSEDERHALKRQQYNHTYRAKLA